MVLYGPRYASALRCIGQVLESHNIDFFELITTESDEFIIECGDPNPPYTGVLKLRFSLDRSFLKAPRGDIFGMITDKFEIK